MARTASLTHGLWQLIDTAITATVVLGALSDADDIAVGITPYPIDDDMATGTVLQAVQILVRGNIIGGIKPVLDMQDDVFDIVANLRNTRINTIPVLVAWRQMSAPIAPDGRGRPEIRDTYYLRTDRLGYAG